MLILNSKTEVNMSRIEGKEKNWGSRSGKSKIKDPKELPLSDKLKFQGLSSDLLELAAYDPEAFSKLAQDILTSKSDLLEKSQSSKLKEVFSTEFGKLYKGDCINLLSTNLIEDDSLDCIFADPPFNLSKDYGSNVSDAFRDEEYLEWTRTWLDLCVKKLKPGGSIFIYNIPKWSTYIAHHLNQSVVLKNWITVDLTLSMPIPNRLYPSHYSLLYFVKGGKPNHFSPPRVPLKTCVRCGIEQNDYGGYKNKMHPEGLNLRDVWTDIPPVRHNKNKNRDANELSLKLLDRVLDIATQKGDIIFDPFGGSGTTYVAAELTGRRWVGVEMGDINPIVERFKCPEDDMRLIDKYHAGINILFTDSALEKRLKHKIPVGKYNINEEQLRRVSPNQELFQ
jgi:site-specific DNA-methyltransferase (adenine-specific)